MKFETARFHFLNDFFARCRRRGAWLHAYKLPIPWLYHGPPRDGISYGYK